MKQNFNELLLYAMQNERVDIIKKMLNDGTLDQNTMDFRDIFRSIPFNFAKYLLKNFNIGDNDLLRENAMEWIVEWCYNSDDKKNYTILPIGITEFFKKKDTVYTLYRGLSWTKSEYTTEITRFGENVNHTVNSELTLTLKLLTSWSTDKNIARQHIKHKDFGVLLKTIVTNNDYILIDITETLPFSELNLLSEVILKPNNYKVEIKEIYNNIDEYNYDLSFGLSFGV